MVKIDQNPKVPQYRFANFLLSFLEYRQYGCQIIGKVGAISGQHKIFDFGEPCAPGARNRFAHILNYGQYGCQIIGIVGDISGQLKKIGLGTPCAPGGPIENI